MQRRPELFFMRFLFPALIVACLLVGGCAAKRDPARTHLENAKRLLEANRVRQAKSEIDAAIRANPSRASTYETVTALCSEKLPIEGAAAAQAELDRDKAHKLDRTLSRDERARVYAGLGLCRQYAGEFNEAESAYKAALAVLPDDPWMLNALGYLYADKGVKLQEAMKLLKRAVELAPDSGSIIDSLAWAQYKLGRYDDALDNLQKAVELEPNEPELRYHLGALYAKRNHKVAAQIELRKALALDSRMDSAAKLLETLTK